MILVDDLVDILIHELALSLDHVLLYVFGPKTMLEVELECLILRT